MSEPSFVYAIKPGNPVTALPVLVSSSGFLLLTVDAALTACKAQSS